MAAINSSVSVCITVPSANITGSTFAGKRYPQIPGLLILCLLYQAVFQELLTLNGTMASVSLKGYNV
jgi:hypothetical protein